MKSELVNQWRRVEGVFVSKTPIVKELSAFLKELNLLACLDWDKDFPNIINISLMENEGNIAGCVDGLNIEPVHEYEELVEKLAKKFDANVEFEDYYQESFEEDNSFDDFDVQDVNNNFVASSDLSEENIFSDYDTLTKCVVLTRTPASVFPFVANIDDTKLGVIELDNDMRAVLQSANSFTDISIIESCDVPYIAFYANDGEYYFVYMPTEEIEDSISFAWSENVELIYANLVAPSEAIVKVVKDVLSPYNIAGVIAGISENSNADNVAKALAMSGREGVTMLMSEFGLNSDISNYLVDLCDLEDVNGAVIHEPRGYANAAERSFNITDKRKHSIFWNKYYSLSVEKPWILNVFAIGVGTVGALLFTNAITKEKRTIKSSLGGILGILLMVEGVAEYMLNKYIGIREESNRRDNNDW